MLKRILGIVVVAMLFSGIAGAETLSGKFYDIKNTKIVKMKQAAADLSAAQAVLFGEYHDQAEIHVAEVKLLEELYRLRGKKLALSLEMFEKDVQPTLNDYLTEKITETVFLENSRPWKNYQEAYKFLVDFAKAKELNVIAGNIPRYLAAKYAKDGSFDNFSETEKSYLPNLHSYPEGAYKERFFATLSRPSSMNIPKERLLPMYRAQCLKDDTMAESLLHAYQADPEKLLYHVQGDFHGSYRLGVTEKLQNLLPQLKIMVIVPIEAKDFDATKDYSSYGDYLFFFTRK